MWWQFLRERVGEPGQDSSCPPCRFVWWSLSEWGSSSSQLRTFIKLNVIFLLLIMMKCETGEMGDGQKNVSTPVQDVGVRGGGVGPARQSGTSRGGQQSWIFLITPASSVYTQPSPATRRRTTSFVLLQLDHHSQRGSLKICSTLFMECLFLECFVKICYGSSLHLLGVWQF